MVGRRGSIALLCCLFAVTSTLVVAGAGPSSLSLVLRRQSDDAVLFCYQTGGNETFEFTFTHSMYGGDVSEGYIVQTDLTLIRASVTADHAGAADYYGLYGEAIPEHGRYTIEVPPLVIKDLRFIADSRAQYRLIGRDWAHSVLPPSGGVDHLVLTVEREAPRCRRPCCR